MARNALMWEVHPEVGSGVSIIAGSMHLNTTSAFKHIDLFEECLSRYENIAFEINMDEGQVGLDDFLIKNGQSLNDFLTYPQKDKIELLLQERFEFPYQYCQQLYPLFTVNLLTQFLLRKGDNKFLDEYLWNLATEKGKRIFGLENVETHYDTLRKIPLKPQVKALKSFLFNLKRVEKEYKKLSRLYAEERIHAIYKITRKSLGTMRKKMLYERNEIMVKEIIDFNAREGDLMVIVGAAHLSGAHGILHHLRKHGYKINPIESDKT